MQRGAPGTADEFARRYRPASLGVPCLLLGDSNVDLLNQGSSRAYRSFLESMGFTQLITSTTRPGSGTCLDHIAIRQCENFLEVAPLVWRTPAFSDHYPVLVFLSGLRDFAGTAGKQAPAGRCRRHDKASIDRFEQKMLTANWLGLYHAETADGALDALGTEILRQYEGCFPETEQRHMRPRQGFHFSPTLRRLRERTCASFTGDTAVRTTLNRRSFTTGA